MLRPFEDRDYEARLEIGNRVFPDHPNSEESLRHGDYTREDGILHKRWVWEEEGRVLAFCQYDQEAWMYHPQKFWIYILVDPAFQNRGIGTACYDHLLRELEQFDPIKLSTYTKDDMPEVIRFLEKRGMKSTLIEQQSSLDLSTYDPDAYPDEIEKVESSGIRFLNLPEYEAECEEARRRIWELDNAISPDIPSSDPVTPLSFETFCKYLFESPHLTPEGWVIALDGDTPVGISNLWKRKGNAGINTGLTGVLRSHRKRGIATACKLRTLRWAKAQGYPWVRTENEESNRGMLGINERLGFQPMPSWHHYEIVLREES